MSVCRHCYLCGRPAAKGYGVQINTHPRNRPSRTHWVTVRLCDPCYEAEVMKEAREQTTRFSWQQPRAWRDQLE